MTVSNHITISIANNSLGLARAGFGVAGVISHSATWAERVRTYTGLSGVAADFPVTTSPEYLAAQALFAQQIKPKQIKILRASLAPTQRFEFTPTAANSTDYKVTVSGEGVTTTEVTYTSDATATVAEICAGLETLLSAVVGKNYTVVDNATSLTITGDAPGDWFSIEPGNLTLMEVEQTHADPGIATDLAAIALEDNDWYCLLTNFNSNAMVLAADAWIQTQRKIYLLDTNETAGANTAVGNSDTGDDLATLERARTACAFHPQPSKMNSASWAGRNLPKNPGSITWKYTNLSGVPTVKLSATQRANLIARNVNFYEEVGKGWMVEGTTADGDFIDVQRGLDWIEDDVSKRVFEVLASNDKISFDGPGIAQIQSAMMQTLDEAVERGILAASPAPVVQVPDVADISAANKTARTLPDMNFSGTLAGAIHKVEMSGTVGV